MPSLLEIRESIEARILEARSEIASLEAARAALRTGGGRPRASVAVTARRRARTGPSRSDRPEAQADTVPPKAAGQRKPRSGTTGRTERPARSLRKTPSKRTAVLLAGKLEAMLGESERGLSVAAISERAGARDDQVRDLLRDLASTDRVRRTGVGRGTRWRLVTDEDRIAERVAELERLNASKR